MESVIIAIYGSRRQDPHVDVLAGFLDALKAAGHGVVMHPKLYSYLSERIPKALGAVREVTETLPDELIPSLALSIGGDGTFLRTAAWLRGRQTPVLGVNTGHLGYLASASVDDLPTLLDDISGGKYVCERRGLIEVETENYPYWPYALNEVTLSKASSASMITAVTEIDGRPLADYSADGLIISTPTGSTAYNLSVGGPIMQPGTEARVIAPIAAHSLTLRPLVVSADSVIGVTVHGRSDTFRLTLDGRSVTLPTGTKVMLRRAPFYINLLRRADITFADTLRSKLHWTS